jgi:dihydroorotase
MSVGETKDQIAIRRPDDWRVHLRDGAMLQADLPIPRRSLRAP